MVCTVVIVSSCYGILLLLLAEYLVGAVEIWLYRKLGGDVPTCKLTSCGRWISFLMTVLETSINRHKNINLWCAVDTVLGMRQNGTQRRNMT
jgi:hypothetical protein